MKYKLDIGNCFEATLLFWCARFIRYKLTTLSNRHVKDKDRLSMALGRLNGNLANIDDIANIAKDARNSGLIGIATYTNPIISLYKYLLNMGLSSMKEIDEEILSEFMSIEASGLSVASRKNYRIAIINFFGYIDKQNQDNNTSHVFNIELKGVGGIRGRSGEKLPAYMNELEIKKFLDGIENLNQSQKINARNKLIIKIIIYTGIRVSEALGLRLKDIFPQDEVYILQVRGKGDKIRTVLIKKIYINDLLQQWLEVKRSLPKSEYLFCNQKGGALTQAYVYKVVEHILKMEGIYKEKMGAHMLRHSFATMLYQKKKDLVLVQEALGHADLNTSRIYTHFDKNKLLQAASIMDDFNKD